MNYFSRNLKFLRESLDVSQQELAVFLKKAQTTIGNWENNRTEPSIEHLISISLFFGISLDALVRENINVPGLITTEHITAFNTQRKVRLLIQQKLVEAKPDESGTQEKSAIIDMLLSISAKLDHVSHTLENKF